MDKQAREVQQASFAQKEERTQNTTKILNSVVGDQLIVIDPDKSPRHSHVENCEKT